MRFLAFLNKASYKAICQSEIICYEGKPYLIFYFSMSLDLLGAKKGTRCSPLLKPTSVPVDVCVCS
jgi:hypothetical protein